MTSNPLRDPRDRRIPRVAGPCVLVLFGVTGDLASKKLLPAIYDLANRGLLPPGFSLVGFARRDWEDEDFAQLTHDAVKAHARTPFREAVWRQVAEGVRFVPGEFADDDAFDRLAQTVAQLDVERGTGGNYAFYLSVPPKAFPQVVVAAQAVRAVHAAGEPRRAAAVAAGRDREAVRPRPGQRPGAQRDAERGVPRVLGLPHRPLPGQGDGPEHPGAALRQHAVRADLEPRLRGPRPDHDGGGHRHRRPGRVLRRDRRGPGRDPEPPAAAAGAHRHGRAGVLRRRRRCARRRRRCSPRSRSPKTSRSAPPAGQYAGGLAGRHRGARLPRGGRHPAGLDHRDLRGAAPRGRHQAVGRGAVLPAHRQAAAEPDDRDRADVPARPAPAVRAPPTPRNSARTPW